MAYASSVSAWRSCYDSDHRRSEHKRGVHVRLDRPLLETLLTGDFKWPR